MKALNLVVDSGGFLKNADIRSLGGNVYSVREVVAEIRDKATRQRLSFLPYEINFKDPSPESIQIVVDAAKKTGDYPSLSSVDIKVMALTYQLTKQFDPESIKEVGSAVKGQFQFGGTQGANTGLPGFYMPDGKGESDGHEITENLVELQIKDPKAVNSGQEKESDNSGDEDENLENAGDEEQGSEDDEGNGWITPSNIQKIQHESMDDVDKDVQVACITTDFAMQNVMIKLGLNIFSIDGLKIRSIRSYVLRCHACFFITKIMTKNFCPKCGNNTLKRVPMEVQPDGTVKYFLSRNPKVLSKRGKKTSLPAPKGGKHAQNPILFEDQPIPQNRVSKKSMQKTNVWSDDYAIDGNPFALNETESKAFRLGIRQGNRSGGRRGNPNAVNRKFVKRR